MTQIATVERILDDTHAEISVPRKSACGHDCEECAGCGVSGVSVYVKALNTVGARPGQKVVVESDTKKMLKIVSFVYLIPVILFLAGYLIMLACNTSVAVQYTAAVAGAVLGILLAIWYDRRVKARGGLSFTIVRVFRSSDMCGPPSGICRRRNWTGSAPCTADCATPCPGGTDKLPASS